MSEGKPLPDGEYPALTCPRCGANPLKVHNRHCTFCRFTLEIRVKRGEDPRERE